MGHAYFMFESVLLRIYVDKKKKKKTEEISWKQGGVCCVSQDAWEAQNPTHSPAIMLPERHHQQQAGTLPCRSHPETDKEETETDILLA